MHGVCDSCGRIDEEVEAVYRMYVVPERWDSPGSSSRSPEREWWCFPCRTHYPHEPVASGPVSG